MKIRNDYVSNSSSSSFIVAANQFCKDNLKPLKIADRVMCGVYYYYSDENDINYIPDELIEKLRKAKITDEDIYGKNETTLIDIDMKKLLLPENEELCKELLDAITYFEVEYGDDCDCQDEFYGYAAWLMNKGFTLCDDSDSSLSLFDTSKYDEMLNEMD